MPCWRASGGSSCIQELLTDGVQVFFTAILPCLSASEGSGSLQELFGVILATKGPTTVGCFGHQHALASYWKLGEGNL